MERHVANSRPVRPRPRRWIAFFVVLGALALVAIVVPLVYNLSLQLRPEELAQARARWQAHGPRDYDLRYSVKVDRDPAADEYLVRVRRGQVVLVGCNGEVLLLNPAAGLAAGLPARALPSEDARNYGVEVLFRQMESLLAKDTAEGKRNYATADFDPIDGH